MAPLNSKILFFALLIQVLPVLAAPTAPLFTWTPSKLVSNLECQRQVQSLLKEWKFTGEWVKSLSHEENKGVILSSPTKDIAVWVNLNIIGKNVSMELLKPFAVKRVTFGKKCVAQTEVQMMAPKFSLRGRFTDLDLAKFVAEKKNGLIYTWSANMPWSVTGIPHIKEAAKKLNLPLLIVQSPASDEKLSQTFVKDSKVSDAELRKPASLEFVMRGMSLHDPSVLWFRNGKLTRWARPGFESKELFVKYFSKEFK